MEANRSSSYESQFFSDGTPLPQEPSPNEIGRALVEDGDPYEDQFVEPERSLEEDYGLIETVYTPDPATSREVLVNALSEIEQMKMWQFIAAQHKLDGSYYEINLVSNGEVSVLTAIDHFSTISDTVTIDVAPGEGEERLQAVGFSGNRAELEEFIIYLREKHAFPDKVPIDPLEGVPLPAILFASVLGTKPLLE